MYTPQSSLVAFQTLSRIHQLALTCQHHRPQLSIAHGYNKALSSHGSQLYQLHTLSPVLDYKARITRAAEMVAFTKLDGLRATQLFNDCYILSYW